METLSDRGQNIDNRIHSIGKNGAREMSLSDLHPCACVDDQQLFTFVSGNWLRSRSLPVNAFRDSQIERNEEFGDDDDVISISLEDKASVYDRMHSLLSQLRKRAQRVRKRIIQPATPSPIASSAHSQRSNETLSSAIEETGSKRCYFSATIDPQSDLSVGWLSLVSLCFIYNAWSVVLRASFPYQTPDNVHLWFIADYVADFVYLIDVVVYKTRVKVPHDGLWITDQKQTCKLYFKSGIFLRDLVSLIPFDILYLHYGVYPLLRLNRLIKIETFWEFFSRFDSIASVPFIIRIVHTLLYMLYLIHLNACAYYFYSYHQGIGRPDNLWIYNGEGNAYIRCIFFSTKTATSIGKNPLPGHEGEYLFMIGSWLSGIFVFAILIAQIRDIVSVARVRDEQYRRLVDRTVTYIRRLRLPPSLTTRCRRWFAYNRQLQANIDQLNVLSCLPLKMEMDVAASVHSNVLNRIKLFQNFDRQLMRELMLKLVPYLYLPGDYVCRKGDIGQHLFIVSYGQLRVIKEQTTTVLGEGSVFGEVNLVCPVGGGNRCTTDVISNGFSIVFVLAKADLHSAIRHYPHSQQLLTGRASRLLRSAIVHHATRPEVPIPFANATPKLLHTVLNILPPHSNIPSLLNAPRLTLSAL